jgi:hypothetical protein
MTSTEPRTEQASDKVSLPTLTAMVVGSMIGSGVFLLPRRFGTETGVLGAIIAWTIAGTGMLMLAFVFQRLATRKPDLDGNLRVRQGRVRRLRRVLFGDRVLGIRLRGQYLVLGAHHGNTECARARIRSG